MVAPCLLQLDLKKYSSVQFFRFSSKLDLLVIGVVDASYNYIIVLCVHIHLHRRMLSSDSF